MVSHGEVPGLGLTLGVIQSSHPQGVTRPAICVISDEARINDEDRANARLIAAAPELLEALKEAEAALNFCIKAQIGTANDWSKSTPRLALEIVIAAIQKAEGGES